MTHRSTDRVRRAIAVTGTLLSLLLLCGCMSPTHDAQAMVAESERVLAVAEHVVPEIARALDLAIVETESTPETGAGIEGHPRSFRFEVRGEFGGTVPRQAALQEAVAAAGLVESVIAEDDGQITPGTDTAPKIIAFTKDESVQVAVTYMAGRVPEGLVFSVFTTDPFYISDEAYREYFPDLIPQFDPSLVDLAGP